jgi:tetratricopeptide (TPR) repeat protein
MYTQKKRGNDLFSDGQYEESIEHYTKAIELIDDRSTYYFNRATAYHRLWLQRVGSPPPQPTPEQPSPSPSQLLQLALTDLSKAITLEPSYGKAIYRKAEVLFALGDWNASFTTFQHSLLFLDAEKMRSDAEIYAQVISEHANLPECALRRLAFWAAQNRQPKY